MYLSDWDWMIQHNTEDIQNMSQFSTNCNYPFCICDSTVIQPPSSSFSRQPHGRHEIPGELVLNIDFLFLEGSTQISTGVSRLIMVSVEIYEGLIWCESARRLRCYATNEPVVKDKEWEVIVAHMLSSL